MDALKLLAELIKQKNQIDDEIAAILQRPAQIGHAGEYIAARIFDIRLVESASHKAIDGYFNSGVLARKSVNIKWYGKQECILDITPNALPDFYLVMTGPKAAAVTSRGGTRPWAIDFAYLFPAGELVSTLLERHVKIGVATSVTKQCWDQAEISPRAQSRYLRLTVEQIKQIGWFSSSFFTAI